MIKNILIFLAAITSVIALILLFIHNEYYNPATFVLLIEVLLLWGACLVFKEEK